MASNSSTALSRLEQIVDEADYIVQREPIAPDSSAEQLFIALLRDGDGKMYLMELMFPGDLESADGSEPAGGDLGEPDLAMLQFYCTFPITAPVETIAGINRVLSNVNQSYPLGAFGVIEATGNIYFRYVFPALDAAEIPQSIVLEVVSMAELAIARLGPLCTNLANGTLDSAAALQDLADRGLFLEPEGATND